MYYKGMWRLLKLNGLVKYFGLTTLLVLFGLFLLHPCEFPASLTIEKIGQWVLFVCCLVILTKQVKSLLT